MISGGIAAQQKSERRSLNGKRSLNGLNPTDQAIREIAGLALAHDTKPSANFGQKPVLMWLPKGSLYVDDRYQREAKSKHSRQMIRRIVETFSWSKFQPVTVAKMASGSLAGRYAVIDGQHRAIAALVHPSVTEIPCWVVDGSDVEDQAGVFVSINRDRINIQPLHLYKAQLAAKDPLALRIDRVCREAGVTIAYRTNATLSDLPPNHTQAVSTIGRLLKRLGDGPVTMALKVLAAAFPDVRGQLRGQVIEVAAMVCARHADKIDQEHFTRILAAHPCDELLESARRFKDVMGGSTATRMMEALVRFYDKGRPPSMKLAKPKTARAA